MPSEMDNQTIVLTLVAAIVISLGGTIVVLSKVSSLGGFGGITGMAQTDEEGQVQINISRVLSIDVTNNLIDFGRCTGIPGGYADTINSNMTESEINATWTNCSHSVSGLPAYIRVVNDGTLEANISLTSDILGSDLLHTPYAHLSYRSANGSTLGGCAALNTSNAWVNISIANTEYYNICKRLQYGAYERHVDIYANLTFDSTGYTEGAEQAVWTFWATTADR